MTYAEKPYGRFLGVDTSAPLSDILFLFVLTSGPAVERLMILSESILAVDSNEVERGSLRPRFLTKVRAGDIVSVK